jgi:L-threonylcarbamoyladenylate synthase
MPIEYAIAELITSAAHALEEGQLVAFPTETVYGLGADAANLSAVKQLYAAKGRPANHPVIVHIYESTQLTQWAVNIPESAQILAAKFWPGPLTIVLPRAPQVLDAVTAGQDTVAVRVPNHPIALDLLREFGGGIVAPSANKFGRLSPTTAADVHAEFKDEVAMVLDGGPCTVGLESTIVDFSSGHPRILRPGMLLQQEIEGALGVPVELVTSPESADVKVPGSLKSHYAPSTPLKLVSSEDLEGSLRALANSGVGFSVIAFSECSEAGLRDAALDWITASDEVYSYARNLYAYLHQLDRAGGEITIAEKVPETPQWAAVRDRLQRAAAQPL